MKRQNIRIVGTLALVAGLAFSALTASAAGRLGQRYLEGTLDGVFWDDDTDLDDGIGGSLTYNQPLANNIDLSLGYSYLDVDDQDAHALDFSGTWFTPAGGGKFYTRAALGWIDTDAIDGEASWALEAGWEYAVSQTVAITPYISYTDLFESGFDGVFDFGVAGEFDIATNTAVIVDLSINEDSDFGASAGFVFRF